MAGTVDIIYPVCCGMDIHKNFLVACIATTDERSHTTHQIRRFSTYRGDLTTVQAIALLRSRGFVIVDEDTGEVA